MEIVERMRKAHLVPVIALERVEDALPLCNALKAGGLQVAEFTFRTPVAREAIRLVASEFPDFILGAGTVTSLDELTAAKEADAGFAVAPGLNPRIVQAAQEMGLPFFPGVATPSEIETALQLGCTTLKLFPAEALGGVTYLKAIYAPYRHRPVQFIPTGGIEIENMNDYLKQPSVVAVGGTWVVKPDWIKAQRWGEITSAAQRATARAREIPGR